MLFLEADTKNYLSKVQNERSYVKIGCKMWKWRTFHNDQLFLAHPVICFLVSTIKLFQKFNCIYAPRTLSPLPCLMKELDLKFEEVLQNDHVIYPSQVTVQVGPPSQSYYCKFIILKHRHLINRSIFEF